MIRRKDIFLFIVLFKLLESSLNRFSYSKNKDKSEVLWDKLFDRHDSSPTCWLKCEYLRIQTEYYSYFILSCFKDLSRLRGVEFSRTKGLFFPILLYGRKTVRERRITYTSWSVGREDLIPESRKVLLDFYLFGPLKYVYLQSGIYGDDPETKTFKVNRKGIVNTSPVYNDPLTKLFVYYLPVTTGS